MQETPHRPWRASRTVRFGRNVLWNLLGQAGLLALGLLLVPLLIRELGAEGYALYGLLGITAGYLGLLSFGSSNATQKTVAERLARGETGRLRTILYFSVFMHTAGVLLGAAAVLILRESLVHEFLNISPELRQTGAWVVACGAAAAVFFSWTHFALAVLQGLQRFGLAGFVTFLQNGLTLAGSAALLRAGFGLRAAAVFFVLIQFIVSLAASAAALRLVPPPSERPASSLADGGETRAFAGYAFRVFLAQSAWAATFQWDKAIIGYFFPLTQLTYYLVPSFLLRRFGVLANSVVTTAFPLMSELAGLGDEEALRKAYRQCSRLALWLTVPGFILLFALAPQFLTLWLGEEFASQSARPLRLMLAAHFIHQLGNMPQIASYGAGRPSSALAWQTLQAVVSVGAWFFLVPRFGITGAALGLLAAQALTTPPYVLLVSRSLFSMRPAEYLEEVLMRPLSAGAVLVLALWLLRDLARTWTSLLGLSAAAVVAYSAAGLALLSAEDRLAFEKLVGRGEQRENQRLRPQTP